MTRRHALLLLALAAALPTAQAQSGKWPDKPVRMVVPFAPGGLDASSEQGPAERGAGTRLRDATVKLAGSVSSSVPAPCASPGSDPKGSPLPPCDAPRLRDANVRESAAAAWMIAQASVPRENYPIRPVRMVVPFAPGGGTDIVARMVAVRLAEEFGQQFVVDNRAGAGGLIGTEIVARAAPDGYTAAVVAASYSANPALYKLAYDPVKGIAPISLIAAGPLILVVHPSVKANDLKEFLALARARPGTLNFGSSGTGSSIHLAFELLRQLTQTDMQHIPYKGTGPAMADLLGGQIQFMLSSAPAAIPQVKAGKLRALAVTTARRSAGMPELPAIGEQVPGFEYLSWYGMWAVAGTPKEIVARLNQALARILKRPDVQERLRADGVEPAHSTPEEFARRLDREIATWKKVVKAGNIKTD